jgi:hypothetical protein
MKKISLVFTALFILLVSNAQSKTGADYFAGTWNILVKGTPGGDSKMFFVLEKKDTLLTGVVQDSTGKEMSKIDKIELNGDKATVYFNAQNYDVNVVMNKKDDDHLTGNLLGMFDVDGDRVKTNKKLK